MRLRGVRERLRADGPDSEFADGALVARLPVAAAPSFVDVYRESQLEMVRLAYLLTGSQETAQDLVQDAFVRLHHQFARVDDPRAYVRRSVVNACVSHHRRVSLARRRQALLVAPAASDSPRGEMFDVIGALPARERAAIVLRYWHDLDDGAIASTLGCRPATVRSLLHRGISRLREVIEP
ncbi:MAG TPA: sigma-70 family RNA polymerase sigma factor [Acidimicrobiia bacterium]|nr:sigma-70 family RNA polymerase sigma factor [Acidimicrobiia bacterium]